MDEAKQSKINAEAKLVLARILTIAYSSRDGWKVKLALQGAGGKVEVAMDENYKTVLTASGGKLTQKETIELESGSGIRPVMKDFAAGVGEYVIGNFSVSMISDGDAALYTGSYTRNVGIAGFGFRGTIPIEINWLNFICGYVPAFCRAVDAVQAGRTRHLEAELFNRPIEVPPVHR